MPRLRPRPQHPPPLGMGSLLSLGDKETARRRDRRRGGQMGSNQHGAGGAAPRGEGAGGDRRALAALSAALSPGPPPSLCAASGAEGGQGALPTWPVRGTEEAGGETPGGMRPEADQRDTCPGRRTPWRLLQGVSGFQTVHRTVLKHVNRESDPRGLRLSLRRQISPLGWVSASSGPGQDHEAPSLQLGRGLPLSADGAGPRELLRPQETAASPPPPPPPCF